MFPWQKGSEDTSFNLRYTEHRFLSLGSGLKIESKSFLTKAKAFIVLTEWQQKI